MPIKVKWRRTKRNDNAEILAITLNQKRHDAAGNRIAGFTFDEVERMTPFEREQIKARGWLGGARKFRVYHARSM